MDSIAPPKTIDLVTDLMPARAPALSSEPGPAANAARKDVPRADVLPDQASVQLDVDAQRFVHTLQDSATSEMLRKYPSEAQLAYSRAVMAYLRALSGR
jgi:hypothetical protein